MSFIVWAELGDVVSAHHRQALGERLPRDPLGRLAHLPEWVEGASS